MIDEFDINQLLDGLGFTETSNLQAIEDIAGTNLYLLTLTKGYFNDPRNANGEVPF